LVPIVNFGSSFSFIAIFLGFLFSFQPLVLIGIGFFSFAVLFQIITLPVELNASARAVKTIREGALLESENEVKGAKSVLTAAAMTYIAALFVSLASLLRLILIVNGGRGRRD
jgi:Zn-dependent membrane protease YugP